LCVFLVCTPNNTTPNHDCATRSMIESAIARRYLWAARKERHMAFLSLITILGLAIGVAALLFSIALLSGLQEHIKEQLIASSPQLLIEPVGGNTIADAPAIVAAAQAAGMPVVRPIVSGIGWGANEEQHRGRPMRIRSYERGSEPPPDPAIRRPSLAPDESEPSIFVTRDFAAGLGLDLGDLVTVIAPRTRLTPFGPVPVWRKYRIVRLVAPGSSEERGADAFLEMPEAQHLLGTGERPTSIEMYGNAEHADDVQAQLAPRFPGVQVKTWKEINRPLYLALRLEKIVMFAAIALIIFVAALNIISSMSMLVLEKRPSVGVLRTLGATDRMILTIFMEVGLFIGLTGTVIGNLFGLGTAWAADTYHLFRVPYYMLGYLPFRIDPGDVLVVNAIAIGLSMLATWYPARTASRLDPIAAIRED
jgi:lipoprotein-releasing system permease protein